MPTGLLRISSVPEKLCGGAQLWLEQSCAPYRVLTGRTTARGSGFGMPSTMPCAAGVSITRVNLSIGSLELFRFSSYDHAFPRHSHDRFTLGVFGADNGSIRVERGKFRAAEGSILAIAPDEAHAADPMRGRGWTYRTLYPSQRIVDVALDSRRSIASPFSRPVFHDAPLARRIEDVHARLQDAGSTLQTEEDLLGVIRHLFARHGSSPSSIDKTRTSVAVTRAREYLDANYALPVKLAELASLCGVTPFHLIHSFRASLGIPPHAYLTQVRAQRAREMLIGGNPLSSVAYMCGFSDQSHLTRVFKRIYGVTPGVYVAASIPRETVADTKK
jgi:AraC-like DNA-binding protein